MNFFSKNLRFLRVSRDLTLDHFEVLGIKKGTMSNYELSKTEPKLELIVALSNFFGITVDDLLNKDLQVSTESPPYTPDNFCIDLLKDTSIEYKTNNAVKIPVVDIEAAAGTGFYNSDSLIVDDYISLPKNIIRSGLIYICGKVKGSSMTPTLQTGSYIIISKQNKNDWANILTDHVYVVATKDGLTYVKRVANSAESSLILTSDNPDRQNYPNIKLHFDDINTIWKVEYYFTSMLPNIYQGINERVASLEKRLDSIEINKVL